MAVPAGEQLPNVLLKYEGLKYSIWQNEKKANRTMNTVPAVIGGAFAAPFTMIGQAVGLLPKEAESKVELKVLDDVSGVIRPGTMTLLLSPPGGGKSTLLKALTARTVKADVKGTVTYSGKTTQELHKEGIHLGQLCQYVDQLDNHMAYLTVRETLEFIASNSLAMATPAQVKHRVDEILDLLHLRNCEHTLIGNDLLRGVSGGEKKRVTIAEGIITNARFLALDEPSTGLDAAVTFSIVRQLRERAVQNGLSVVIALLQPTPEVYALFDDVILMREGAVVYHGAREALPRYLSRLGFLPPTGNAVTDSKVAAKEEALAAGGSKTSLAGMDDNRVNMDMADWLTELITFPSKTHTKDVAARGEGDAERTPGSSTPSKGKEIGMSLTPVQSAVELASLESGTVTKSSTPTSTSTPNTVNPPFTTEGLVAAWKGSKEYTALMALGDASVTPKLDVSSEFAKAQYGRQYVHHPMTHAKSLLARQFKLMTRNKLFIGFRVFSAVFMSIVFGGLYYGGGIEDGLNKYGLFLNAAMHVAFANISEMSGAVQDKYVAYRQVSNGAHPAWVYPLAAIIAHLPVAFAESLSFGAIAYFMAGMTPDAGRFFFFTLVILLCDIFAALLFRTFAYSAPTLVAAQAGPMPVIALLIMFAGFMVTRSKMGWMEFLYYLDVFAYAIHSLAQNEFMADRYKIVPPGSTGTETLGDLYLTFFDMSTNTAWKWGGVGFMAGAILLTGLWSFWAFATIRYDRNVGSGRLAEEITPAGAVAVSMPKGLPGGNGGGAVGEGGVPSTTASSGSLSTAASTTNGQDAAAQAMVTNPMLAARLADAAVATSARSVLPFVPQTVAWRDLQYTVNLPKQLGGGSKVLLQGITGYALPGRMLALMGASGAGKTTLLDVLGGRKNSGVQTGSVYLNGHPKEEKTFNRIAAYCEQMDLHYPLTTVREALEFSAELRLPGTVSKEQMRAFVTEVIDILELTPLAARKVGDPGDADGLAPGERKRLTIGVELVSNAPVIFLDEPTSGLDSRAAAVVMRVIKNVASTGRTVICTIHQPSAELFFLFDDLLLLQRGGYQVYFGPLGYKAANLLSYMQGLPGVHKCPPGYNPATYMLDVLAGTDSSGTIEDEVADVHDETAPTPGLSPRTPFKKHGKPVLTQEAFQESFFTSPLWTGEGAAAQTVAKLCKPEEGSKPLSFSSPRARSFLAQYRIMTGRQWRNHLRNIPFNVGRLGALTGLCILFGTIYFDLASRSNDVAGVQSLTAAIFMTAAFSAMLNMDASLPTLIKTRPNYYREQASLMYHPGAFNLSYATVELPWLALGVLVATSIAYFMIGLSPSASIFFFHYLVTFILAAVLVSLGMAVAMSMPSFDVAQAVIGTAAPILFLFGGMFSAPSKMPAGTRWVNIIDPITYAFSSLVAQHFHCEGGAAAGCPTVVYPDPVYGPIPVDRDQYVTTLYELDYPNRWKQVGYLAIFVVVFQTLAVLAVRYVRHIVR